MGENTKEKLCEEKAVESGGGEMDNPVDALGKMMECAYELQKKCSVILDKAYGNQDKTFPIDIKKVACTQGIELVYGNLNVVGEKEIDLNIAQLRYEIEKGEIKKRILVDDSRANTEEESYSNLQKYAIAYELGKTIVGEESRRELEKLPSNEVLRLNMKSVPYSLPRMYARLESFEYEMCAIFLLLPLGMFLEEFFSYIKEIEEHPVHMDKWIKHLSDKTGIPNYQLINGYQYIKFCAYQYYKENAGEDKDNKYWELYR